MQFEKFVNCVNHVKKSTYLIARGIQNEGDINWETLGTGVIVSGCKLLTCAHVIKGNQKYIDGLPYYFIRHDDLEYMHLSIFNLFKGKNLFIYDKFDLAIIDLNEGFYESGDQIYKEKTECININTNSQNIGTDVGILGYPLCKLEFFDKNEMSPCLENIILRTDKGVINGKFKVENIIYNNFTIQFNEGNSGGPIFSPYDGSLLGLVNGYQEGIISAKPIYINEKLPDGSEKTYRNHNIHKYYYSIGIPVENYFDILKKHKII